MNSRPLTSAIVLACVLTSAFPVSEVAGKAPKQPRFPEALRRANIVQEDISDVLQNALIIGNGDINALVHMEGNRLIVRLSKNDIGDWRNDTATDDTLVPWRKLRELGKEGKVSGGDRQQMGWNRFAYPTPISCGKVMIDLQKRDKTPAVLDIGRAVTRVGVHDATADAAVTIRALSDRNVFLIESRGEVALVSQQARHLERATTGRQGKVYTLYQQLPPSIDWPGMSYAVAIASLESTKAIAVVSSFEAEDPRTAAVELAQTTLARADRAVAAHEDDWSTFWAASGVELPGSVLEADWYRNLYFLRTVSRPDTAMVGLFAGVCNDNAPAWHGGHTMNYNCQQTVWSGYAANHVELTDSYRWLITQRMDNARWLCRQLFEFDGIYFSHNIVTHQADHATSKQPLGGAHMHMPWGYSVGMTGWVGQNLWWQYQYAPDKTFLRRTAYPVLKEAACFYASFMDRCEKQSDGKVLFGPSVSPEHHGMSNDLRMNWNETHGLVYARFGLEVAIEAAKILDTDKALVVRWQRTLAMLPTLPTSGSAGDEVIVTVKGAKQHECNVPVPAFPVFPGEHVTWFSPNTDKTLLSRTISRLPSNGNNDTVILSIARARLSLPGTYEYVVDRFNSRRRPNGSLTLNRRGHHFNAFGHYTEMFAASAVVSELLLQSSDHIVRVFPAWPKNQDASFKQLRAKGGFLVSAALSEGEVPQVTVESTVGGWYAMLSPWPAVTLRRNDNTEPLKADSHGVVRLSTRSGETLVFRKDHS